MEPHEKRKTNNFEKPKLGRFTKTLMIKLITSTFLLFPLLLLAQVEELRHEQIQEQVIKAEEFINHQNEEFLNPEESPLHEDSIGYFKGLDYYPINEQYIVVAEFKRIKKGKEFEMKTSTDRLPIYQDYAILTFNLDGKEHQLHAYKNVELSKQEEYKDYLFLPFNDHTNGIESYGGGRYLDLTDTGEEQIILNFNMTYNPYCAYNDKYSCPIPPDENKLDCRIEAGVKKFH